LSEIRGLEARVNCIIMQKPVIGAQKAGWRRLPQSRIEQPNAGTHIA